jgi:hypothetical protein
LTALAYPLYSPLSNASLINPDAVQGYDRENTLLKKQFMQSAPKNDLEKRAPQLQILSAIKERKK